MRAVTRVVSTVSFGKQQSRLGLQYPLEHLVLEDRIGVRREDPRSRTSTRVGASCSSS